MNKYIFLVTLFTGSFLLAQNSAASIDSVRMEVIDGKKFIVHKVDPKETLYALSKRYQVSIEQIRANNEEEKDGYDIDQIGRILFIPLIENVQVSAVKSAEKMHTVQSGETLYALSKKYNVDVKELKKWNSLKSDQLELGQQLVVSKPNKNTKSIKNTSSYPIKDAVHVVDVGETIYGISKQYNVQQKEIIAWNDLDGSEISVGQKLVIRKSIANASQESSDPDKTYVSSSVQKFHIANRGESYADIAEAYNVVLSKLEKWNSAAEPFKGGEEIMLVKPDNSNINKTVEAKNSTSNSTDKRIHTAQSGETLYRIAEMYDVELADLRKWNNLTNYSISIGQKIYISNPDAFVVTESVKEEVKVQKEQKPKIDVVAIDKNEKKHDTKAYFTVEEEDIPEIEKITEKGVAETIEGSDNTDKYLALHRTAKIGTIMQVRNDLNDQIVFVRVLGKMPNNGVDDKVIIRISKKAFQKLGGVDYKFPVEISYLPLND